MAKKKVTALIKLQVPAGKATPAPPVGPALGPHGVPAPQFVQQFNDRTKNYEPGLTIPVVITVFADRSFTFVTKTPPASVLLKKAAKHLTKIHKVTADQFTTEKGKYTFVQIKEEIPSDE